MNLCYENTEQISKSFDNGKHIYPKYGKSTTDPTYYEPAATRIANMKKASGAKLEGIYDYYSKDDVSKFNEDNFNQNIRTAQIDPRFQNKLLKEEISQITTSLGNEAQDIVDTVKAKTKAKQERINESLEVSKAIDTSRENSKEE